MVRKNINTANNVLTNTLPWLPNELGTMAMDKSVKPYSRIAAISEAFKILQTGVVEQQQRSDRSDQSAAHCTRRQPND